MIYDTWPPLPVTLGVPLPLVSKTLRHTTSRITADLYGHLTAETALAAADSLGNALDAAAAELASARHALRPQHHDPSLLPGTSPCAYDASKFTRVQYNQPA